jgi:hypothetical protein
MAFTGYAFDGWSEEIGGTKLEGSTYTPVVATTLYARWVESDTTAPTVSNVTSNKTNGTYTTSESISIQITFTESVTVTGTPQLTLETGTTDRTVNYASGTHLHLHGAIR